MLIDAQKMQGKSDTTLKQLKHSNMLKCVKQMVNNHDAPLLPSCLTLTLMASYLITSFISTCRHLVTLIHGAHMQVIC